MSGYLLDTDICIRVLRRKSAAARERLDAETGRIFMSVITLAELTFGGLKSGQVERAAEEIHSLSLHLTVLPFDASSAADYAAIRMHLERTGQRIGPNDLLIAAQARAAGLVLVTGNRREFDRVPDLKVETWIV